MKTIIFFDAETYIIGINLISCDVYNYSVDILCQSLSNVLAKIQNLLKRSD